MVIEHEVSSPHISKDQESESEEYLQIAGFLLYFLYDQSELYPMW